MRHMSQQWGTGVWQAVAAQLVNWTQGIYAECVEMQASKFDASACCRSCTMHQHAPCQHGMHELKKLLSNRCLHCISYCSHSSSEHSPRALPISSLSSQVASAPSAAIPGRPEHLRHSSVPLCSSHCLLASFRQNAVVMAMQHVTL
jgi:hypothetical protein